jgi:hypothetical protein
VSSARRLPASIYFACAVATAIPLFFAKQLPLSDLPEHSAVVAALARQSDPDSLASQTFVAQGALTTPYVLYHYVAAYLAGILGSAEHANLALLAIAAASMIPAQHALLRAVRGEPWLALLAGPLFWNGALQEGLINFVVSIPVAIFALAVSVRHAMQPRWATAWKLVALSVTLFYLHSSSLLLFVAGSLWFTLVWYRSVPTVPMYLRMPWLLPFALLMPVLVYCNLAASHDGGEHAGTVRFLQTRFQAEVLWSWMHDFWRAAWDDILAASAWAIAAALLCATAPPSGALRQMRVARRGLAFLGAVFYFTLPTQVNYAFILDVRMAPFVALCFLTFFAERRGAWLPWCGYGLVAVNILYAVLCARSMAAYQAGEASAASRLIDQAQKGKRLLTLAYAQDSAYLHHSPFGHFGSYYQARSDGISGVSYSEMPHWPLRYRAGLAPPRKAITLWGSYPCAFRNHTDGMYYDLILVRGSQNPFAHLPPGPTFRLREASGAWALYEKTSAAVTPGVDPGFCGGEEP